MAYYYDPNSYANTLFSAPFSRRRPSPSPATYYPREAYDPYLRALAEEQAARSALQDAARREREARQRRAEEEAKAQIRERMRKEKEREERARQLRQSFYGYPYGYPTYEYGYETPGCGDEDDNTPYFCGQRREPVKKRETHIAPQLARSPMNKRQQSRDPVERSTRADTSSKTSIPISTPSKASVPKPSEEEKNAAASKIQSAFRVHSALRSVSSVRERLSSLLSLFTLPDTLDFDMLQPPKSEDERPKLAYTSRNASVHGHEDALVKLLQTLDAIESHGDIKVREARRELVREVEKELARVDAEVRRKWEETLSASLAVEPTEKSAEAPTEDAMEVEKEALDPTDVLNTDEVVEASVAAASAPTFAAPIPKAEQHAVAVSAEPMEIEPSPSPEPYILSVSQPDLTEPHPEEVEEYFTPEELGPVVDAEEATPTTSQVPMIDSADTLTETEAKRASQEDADVRGEESMDEDVTSAEEPAPDTEHPARPAASESPAESEVETPPHVSLPLPHPAIHTPEGEHSTLKERSPPLEFQPMQVEKTPLSVDTRTPAERKPVSIDDGEDQEGEDDEVVIVESDRLQSSAPASPVTEKDFVVV